MMRGTSISANNHLTISGKAAKKRQVIEKCLEAHPDGLTRREVAEITGIEINCVTGRTREMIKSGKLTDKTKVICETTGRPVHLVRLARLAA